MVLIAMSCALMVGCGTPSKQEASSTVEDSTEEGTPVTETVVPVETELEGDGLLAEPELAMESMQIEGFKMRLYEEIDASIDEQKPTFFMRAALVDTRIADAWKLTGPNAIVYGEEGDDMTLNADAGSFNNERQLALLSGNVRAMIGAMTMRLAEINWDNTQRLAYSDTEVELEGDDANLVAQGIQIDPKTGAIVMDDVTGTIRLGEM